MRSLWQQMALRWLGGKGSDVLAGDSDRADSLSPAAAVPVFRVARDPHASPPVRPTAKAPEAADRDEIVPSLSRRS